MMFRLLLLLLLNTIVSFSWAANELTEMEYEEQISASLTSGEILHLNAQGKQFLGLYTATEEPENQGAAIILHPMNGHPDQQKLIHPLRTYLPDHHWATLSIQLPVLGVGAIESDYYPIFDEANVRIQAAVNFLVNSKKIENIVLIGYRMGGMMALNYLQQAGHDKHIKAIATISLSAPDTVHEKAQVINFISTIKLPFLDIFAEYDTADVTNTARKRRIAGRINNDDYRQFQIEGEGHLFQHDEGLVVKRIYSWIYWTFSHPG